MSSPGRIRLGVDERRKRLLVLGLRLFSDRTYDEVSIDEIARAAGISKGLLYHYFPSKRDYYVEVVREAARELLAETEPIGAADLDGLRRALDAYLDYADRHARAYSMLLRGGVGTDPEVLEIVEQTRQQFVRRCLEAIGVADPPPLLRTAIRGWIGFVEATSLDWLDHHDLRRDDLRELMAAALAQAIVAGGGALPEV